MNFVRSAAFVLGLVAVSGTAFAETYMVAEVPSNGRHFTITAINARGAVDVATAYINGTGQIAGTYKSADSKYPRLHPPALAKKRDGAVL
jgi:hypothetical protein